MHTYICICVHGSYLYIHTYIHTCIPGGGPGGAMRRLPGKG